MLLLVTKNSERRHTCNVIVPSSFFVTCFIIHTTSTLGSKCLRIMHTNMDWVISKLILDDFGRRPRSHQVTEFVCKKHSIVKHN